MIELDVNGSCAWIEPASLPALEAEIERVLPEGHAVCGIWVNGEEANDLTGIRFEAVRNVRVQTGHPQDLAQGALGETHDWIGRICQALATISNHYRLGREPEAAAQLADVADALQVLFHLLEGIRENLALDAAAREGLDGPWKDAESQLADSIQALAEEAEAGDPIRLADRTGHDLPSRLVRFQALIEQVPAGRGRPGASA